jgi:hypothetical protein
VAGGATTTPLARQCRGVALKLGKGTEFFARADSWDEVSGICKSPVALPLYQMLLLSYEIIGPRRRPNT